MKTLLNSGGHIVVVIVTIAAVAVLIGTGHVTSHTGLLVIVAAAGVGAGISGGAKVPGSPT